MRHTFAIEALIWHVFVDCIFMMNRQQRRVTVGRKKQAINFGTLTVTINTKTKTTIISILRVVN